MREIAIIGAGPAGNFLAWKLAERGYPVDVYEEHNEIGKPVQCTGIVTKTLRELVPIDPSFFVNQLEKVEVVAPDATHFEVPVEDFVICRTSFDQFLLKKAVEAGARAHRGHKCVSVKDGKLVIQNQALKKEIQVTADIVVGADGPNSVIGKLLNPNLQRQNYYGAQATVKGTFDPKKYVVYLGDICPEFFGWVVPEDETHARVGLAVKKDTAKYFKQFLAKLGISELQITDYQGGLIPVYIPQLKIEGVVDGIPMYLLGDAATQIKSTTGGGIIPGLQAANILLACIYSGEDYQKALKKSKLFKELWIHLILRRALDLFSEKEYNKLIGILNKKSVVSTMSEIDRDNPIKLLATLLRRNPFLPLHVIGLFARWKFIKGCWQFWWKESCWKYL